MSDPDLTREERLRQLMTEAVDPIEPAPGAEARLLARIRAEQNPQGRLAHRLRWAGVGLTAAAAIAGVVVIGVNFGGRTDSASSNAASSAGSAAGPSMSSPAKAPVPEAAGGAERALNPAPNDKDLAAAADPARTGKDSSLRPGPVPDASPAAGSVAGSATGSNPGTGNLYDPNVQQALTPSDLDGDGKADRLSIVGARLVAELSAFGRQSVELPQVGPGAVVLGIGRVSTPSGQLTPVAFIRVDGASNPVRDTLVVVVAGKLAVVQANGNPVVLAASGPDSYGCAGPLTIGGTPPRSYVVNGDRLVQNASFGGLGSCFG